MIDTIRFKIKVKEVNPDFLISMSCQKEGKLKYKIFKDVINVGSFSYFINLYISNENELFLEFSLPKYLFGHNLSIADFSDLLPVLKEIQKTLKSFCTPAPLSKWEVQRIDICSYRDSENPYSDIFFYQAISFPRKKKYIYDTSVMFVGSSYSIKVYIKEDEFFRHDFKRICKSDMSFAYNLLAQSKGKIRIETSYRKKVLSSLFQTDHLSVYNLLKDKEILLTHNRITLKKIYADVSPEKMEQKNLLKELKKYHKPQRALQLYQFYVFYISDDENKRLLKEMYSRSQIYRNFKAIREAIL